MDSATDAIEAFITRWQDAGGRERANYQLFLTELTALLDLPAPEPASGDERDNAYVFERRVQFRHGDGSESYGYIDLYRRGCFVLEAKDVREASDSRYDAAMLRARSQAEAYARALPAAEGRPPFVVVVDVGHTIELYSEFSRSGATYTPFPDPRSHRIALADLRRPAIRERLRQLWLAPLDLDPARESARVTREIAARLAELARSLEGRHAPETVAQFLTRCLFTMFAEDVQLLPADSFRDLLIKYAGQPDVAMRMLGQLWHDMDAGGFSAVLASDVLRFNGKLFKSPATLPLDRDQIQLLIDAAQARWENVEPAIFGTLLERALNPAERHRLGAHYTPRAYVERLVLPAVIEPLRAEWSDAQAAALTLASEGKADAAVAALRAFHHRLCTLRVLDPACGSGNFLYVTLEHLKRLEGEVLNALDELGFRQTGLAIDGERADALAGETVDPHQLLGIEVNPRAAAIAELVLWIGYLQWHFRIHGNVHPPEPVVHDFRNIENRDAVLAYDAVEYVSDARGVPVTRWDGKTYKPSPVTGEPIPDEAARVPLERYVNPRKAAWPQADFVVGNPPFIGNKRMRIVLGDGYVEALRGAWAEVPDTSDFVMYWWHHAATLTQRGALQRFGFITTNSIRQTFNRRVIEAALLNKASSSLLPAGEGSALLPSPSGRGAGGEGTHTRNAAQREAEPSPGATRHHGALGHGRQLYPGGEGKAQPLSLTFAIPDHPWVDSSDGADVRIAMTVASPATRTKEAATEGRALMVATETPTTDGEIAVALVEHRGVIHADLRTGANVGAARKLQANTSLCFQGMNLVGKGFRLTPAEVTQLGYNLDHLPEVIKPYCNARDFMQGGETRYVIDLFGLTAEEAREQHPALYQWLHDRVKPERDQNNRESRRRNWWLFGEPVGKLRNAWQELRRVILTPETSKHRVFTFVGKPFCPDHTLYAGCLDDAMFLGVLSSSMHERWALAAGGTLEDRPRYNNSRCFDPFPFPAATEAQQARIRKLGEQLDAHRKRQQALHPDLTLTGMYNVLEKLRAGAALTAKERVIHEHGLVSVLRQLHDELDAAVLDAYGWSDLLPLLQVAHGLFPTASIPSPSGRRWRAAPDEGAVTRNATPREAEPSPAPSGHPLPVGEGKHAEPSPGASRHPLPEGEGKAEVRRAFDAAILERLVALNAERAAEEARGVVRWLRPAFQHPAQEVAPQQGEIATTDKVETATPIIAGKPRPWPRDAIDQVRAVAGVLAASAAPLSADDVAAHFSARGAWKKRLPPLLDMLAALGRAREYAGKYSSL